MSCMKPGRWLPNIRDASAIQAVYELNKREKGKRLIVLLSNASLLKNLFGETEENKKLLGHFLKQGLTAEQAKIKYVLQDKRISSACVGMSNITNLKSNVEAALNKTKLTTADMAVFKEYAKATCSSYCTACAHICDSTLPDASYISDIMRYLMYYNSYGEQAEARRLFAQIPAGVRNKLLDMDYTLAEARCPQRLPITELIAEAVSKLA